jgi:hypothetical protein
MAKISEKLLERLKKETGLDFEYIKSNPYSYIERSFGHFTWYAMATMSAGSKAYGSQHTMAECLKAKKWTYEYKGGGGKDVQILLDDEVY